jgi:hypothetical protein
MNLTEVQTSFNRLTPEVPKNNNTIPIVLSLIILVAVAGGVYILHKQAREKEE